MAGRYLGELSQEDPLQDYLQFQIAPQLGFTAPRPSYDVFQFSDSRDVYLYVEKHGGPQLVGKYFQRFTTSQARQRGETEFNNLLFLRALGLSAWPHRVARPYGFNPDINNLLLIEYVAAEPLSGIIDAAIHGGRRNRLFRKLSALAHFLAGLHHRTVGEWTVNFEESHQYMGRLLQSLIEKWGLGGEDSEELRFLGDTWRHRGCMWQDRGVLVHGDATPSNLLFGKGPEVIAIDLERMKWADRVFDLGRLCGELKHFFFQATADPLAAEPFIGHLLWEYSGLFPDRESAFHAITRRIPFYMGITLLRIARNSWIDDRYRWRLIHEAKQILRAR